MKVSAWKSGKGVNSSYGIRIGNKNRDTSFNKGWAKIILEINSIITCCKLTPGFWNKCPEIRDDSIKKWLKQNNNLTWPKQSPPTFNLDHVKGNHFRLY